jgi:hypothetical protein
MQNPPNAPCIFAPLLRFLTFTFLEHPCPKSIPDDHSACDDCTEQDDAKVPAGDGGGDETKDAEEDAEMGARGVRGSGVVYVVDLRTCVQGARGFVGTVERDRCSNGDAPW